MKELLKRKMKLKDTSDVILQYSYWRVNYKNFHSNKAGDDLYNLIEPDRKYLIVKENKNKGFFAEYIKEHNALIVYCVSFQENKGAWMEDGRIVFSRNDGKIYKKGYLELDNVPDITGCISHEIYVPGKCTEIIRDFFGGYLYSSRGARTFFTNSKDIRYLYNYWEGEEKATPHEINMDEFGEINETIPATLRQRMGMLFKNYASCYPSFINKDYLYTGVKCAYLQNTEWGYIARCFCCIAVGPIEINNRNNINIRFIEYGRIGINDRLNINDSTVRRMLNIPLAFYDKNGIEDGYFKYSEFILKKLANNTKKVCEANKRINDKIVLWINCNKVFNAVEIRNNKIYEKIVNSSYEAMKADLASLHMDANGLGIEKWLEEIYGDIDWDKNPLHQMLGIPLYMLKQLGNNREIVSVSDTIRSIKDMFISNKAYLANMQQKSVDSLISCMKKCFGRKLDMDSTIVETVSNLVNVFGPQNIENYLTFCARENSYKERLTYRGYTERIVCLKDFANGFEWKLKGKELKRSFESIEPAYEMYKNRARYQKYIDRYKKLVEERWSKYQYESDDLMIVCPKSPIDVIAEGVKLHHCAKGFVETVGDGQTTLLFIRKKDMPYKPYFTLEIRNNKVRQCHGNNNISIEKSPKLQAFLKGFCRKYGISYNLGEKQLGV